MVVENARSLACLDEWEPYARLCARQKLVQRRRHLVAILPFVLVLFIGFRLFPKLENNLLGVAAVSLSLVWALLVCVYGIVLIIRIRAIHCPNCRAYFGSEDECMSCGLRRHVSQID